MTSCPGRLQGHSATHQFLGDTVTQYRGNQGDRSESPVGGKHSLTFVCRSSAVFSIHGLGYLVKRVLTHSDMSREVSLAKRY